jgi:N-acetylglutamate synthase-like GNAT family acetyltransferase
MSYGENKAMEGTEREPFTTHETERRTLIEIEAAPGVGNTPHDRLPRWAVRRAGVGGAAGRANGRGPEEMLTNVGIRPAVDADAATIKAMVRAERVNPRNLHWPRFLVAEVGGRIVGVQQIRIHKGGTREVASRVVLPKFRRRGIGTDLLRAALVREHSTLYLQCNENWTPYYERFGFRRVEPAELPADLRREHRIARVFVALRSLFVRRKLSVVPMKRDA